MSQLKADKWKQDLQAWGIPEEILNQAPESPWIHPPTLFQIPEQITDTFSHQKAREALSQTGTVLDIGCGGGIAAFAIATPTNQVIGVDHQKDMLEMFTENALKRGIASQVFEGFWPQMSTEVSVAEVVTAHHVVYNVQEIVPFLKELNSHAINRVVIELPAHHPLANMDQAWKHFWKLERPKDPTPKDLVEVLAEIGIKANLEYWSGQMRQETNIDQAAEFMTTRLCLAKDRQSEVKAFLEAQPKIDTRDLATIWWDKN